MIGFEARGQFLASNARDAMAVVANLIAAWTVVCNPLEDCGGR